MRGKAGFSDEYLDKLDSETRDSLQENGDAVVEGEPDLRWERLRLSDGDLLSASRDPEFEKLKVIISIERTHLKDQTFVDFASIFFRVLAVPIPVWEATMRVLKTAELQPPSVVSKWCCGGARNLLRRTSNSGRNRKSIGITTTSSAVLASCPAHLPPI